MTKKLKAIMKKQQLNVYDCKDCLEKNIEHEVISVPGEKTDKHSTWGPGLPTTYRKCTACGAKDGPWISAALVGDY